VHKRRRSARLHSGSHTRVRGRAGGMVCGVSRTSLKHASNWKRCASICLVRSTLVLGSSTTSEVCDSSVCTTSKSWRSCSTLSMGRLRTQTRIDEEPLSSCHTSATLKADGRSGSWCASRYCRIWLRKSTDSIPSPMSCAAATSSARAFLRSAALRRRSSRCFCISSTRATHSDLLLFLLTGFGVPPAAAPPPPPPPLAAAGPPAAAAAGGARGGGVASRGGGAPRGLGEASRRWLGAPADGAAAAAAALRVGRGEAARARGWCCGCACGGGG
jgi:hypothetical protein